MGRDVIRDFLRVDAGIVLKVHNEMRAEEGEGCGRSGT